MWKKKPDSNSTEGEEAFSSITLQSLRVFVRDSHLWKENIVV